MNNEKKSTNFSGEGLNEYAIKQRVSQIIATIAKRTWPQYWANMLDELGNCAEKEISLMVRFALFAFCFLFFVFLFTKKKKEKQEPKKTSFSVSVSVFVSVSV